MFPGVRSFTVKTESQRPSNDTAMRSWDALHCYSRGAGKAPKTQSCQVAIMNMALYVPDGMSEGYQVSPSRNLVRVRKPWL